MKKQTKKNGKFTVTEVGALIEDLRGQFKIFGDGLNDLREKVDTVTGMVDQEAEKSTMSRLDIMALKNTVTQINGKLAGIEKDMRLIRDNLVSKADRSEFEILEKKVASFTG